MQISILKKNGTPRDNDSDNKTFISIIESNTFDIRSHPIYAIYKEKYIQVP